jgi:pimeloyl-ACP methyl ester carboxylesterase/class 3 adenylate cyclase
VSTSVPATRYAKNGPIHIAYQALGTGPVDLVYIPGIFTHIEHQWEEPSFARFLRRLASFSRLLLLDPRGIGLSDRAADLPIFEDQMDDVRAVLDAVGSERAFMFGVSQGGPMAILFAATHPDRTAGLILYGTYPTVRSDPDIPWGRSEAWVVEYLRQLDEEWGTGSFGAHVAPSRAGDGAFRDWWARLERLAAGPGNAMAYARANIQADVRPVLSAIRVPTLVLQRRHDTYRDVRNGVYLADHIPGSRLVEVDGVDHLPFVGDPDALVDEIQEFLTGTRPTPEPDRVLATILFTDIAGSTRTAVELGDRSWRQLLEQHRAAIRRELERYRGREVETAGDGFLATFDGPARAINCAVASRQAVRSLGLELRAGLHTGEVEVSGPGLAGIGVHIGARVAALADAGQILVSGTVKDLVAGSGIGFDFLGTRRLKGVPGEWPIYLVQTSTH